MGDYEMPAPQFEPDDKTPTETPKTPTETPIERHAGIIAATDPNGQRLELERALAQASILGARISLQALTIKWLLTAASANIHYASVAMAVCDHLDVPALDTELRQLHDRALTLTNNIRQIYNASLLSAPLPAADATKGKEHGDR